MKRHSLSAFLVLALVLILSSVITASAQQPRAVPPNDDFANAQAIQAGKSYLVPDISAATNGNGEVTASCMGGGFIPNSVWFSITQPRTSHIAVSTFGTLLLDPYVHSSDTVLAVYDEVSPGGFIEIACNDDANFSNTAQLTFEATGGNTYYIVAGTFFNFVFLPESTLKLSTRMLDTEIYPPNYDFELPISAADWKVKNGGDDQVVCSEPGYPAINGDCAFRFTGTPGVTTKLIHTLPFPSAFLPRKDALLSTSFIFRVMDTASLGNTKVKMIINYSNGMPPSTHTIDLTGTAAMDNYGSFTHLQSFKGSKVASIKFVVKFASSSGTLMIDAASYSYHSEPGARSSGLLPVPPAAK